MFRKPLRRAGGRSGVIAIADGRGPAAASLVEAFAAPDAPLGRALIAACGGDDDELAARRAAYAIVVELVIERVLGELGLAASGSPPAHEPPRGGRPLAAARRAAAELLAGLALPADGAPRDVFRALYQAMIPAAARHDFGEYYTPRWLAQAVLAEVPAPPGWRGLDPCCGSGAFVVELIGEVLAETAGRPAGERLTAVLGRVAGLDRNPLAVLTARANYLLAIAPLLREAGAPPDGLVLPVRLGDATAGDDTLGRFERVVGNPPWVEWRDLSAAYREPLRELARGRGLLSADAYAGGTDLNLCALIAHVALERFVARGGTLGFLMPHQLLQTRSSQGLRRWRLPDGAPIGLAALSDWSALRPFAAACKPVTYVLRPGEAGPATVPVRVWRARPGAGARADDDDWPTVARGLEAEPLAARMIGDDGGPYMIDAPAALTETVALFGACAYRGRRATETSPHGVYWVRALPEPPRADGLIAVENGLNPRARDGVASERWALERDRLHPLLRAGGVAAFGATPGDALVIVPHDARSGARALAPELMPPRTRAYMERYRALLERRGSYREYRAGQPFYGLWRVGPYTFAPWKVVWPELGELRAAVIGTAPTPWGERKLVVPEGKINMIGCEDPAEAHYLCALLNAPAVRRAYARVSSQLGRPARLPFAIPPWSPARWSHRALAAVSLAAHAGRLAGDRREALLAWLLARAVVRAAR